MSRSTHISKGMGICEVVLYRDIHAYIAGLCRGLHRVCYSYFSLGGHSGFEPLKKIGNCGNENMRVGTLGNCKVYSSRF